MEYLTTELKYIKKDDHQPDTFALTFVSLTQVGQAPVCGLCRKIMDVMPWLGDMGLKVIDAETGKLRFTTAPVEVMAKHSYTESDAGGIRVRLWKEMPSGTF